jgi:hypothetical protein
MVLMRVVSQCGQVPDRNIDILGKLTLEILQLLIVTVQQVEQSTFSRR